jgi:hypothetical protein
MMLKLAGAFFAVSLISAIAFPASAVPITIVQEFGPLEAPITVNGVSQQVTGSWVFDIKTDTANPDLDPDTDVGRFAISLLTVSNPGLALLDMVVASPTLYYYERSSGGTDQSGIVDVTNSFGTSLGINSSVLGDPNMIEPSALDFGGTLASVFVFISEPLVLADGTMIQTTGEPVWAESGRQSSYFSVPSPSTAALLALGLLGLGLTTRQHVC